MEHLIKLDGTFNTRDLGGYQSADGRTVKTHKLYRSDDLFNLSRQDQQKLEALGINLIIDYRSAAERQKRPNRPISGAKTVILSPEDEIAAIASGDLTTDREKINKLIELEEAGKLDTSTDFLKQSILNYVNTPYSQQVYAQMIKLLGSSPELISLQHCRGGKDRTGYGSALVLLLLGVDEETVVQDYLLTSRYNNTRNNQRMNEYRLYTDNQQVLKYLFRAMDTRASVMRAAIDEMKKRDGTILSYLTKTFNLDQNFINNFRNYYLT
ncbi:tyrosine-protein phosphatase [Xylocopilactobacillus apicola]|uniref:Protein-tyrosine-phosphatase n=1 Tax=Xylocopilactobacillus apicola TaxID=2932184 RepID=A0AAU9DA95_9LACO|nr:tyrosine-protein phosphatase [Xylocopilactobacillus apicola]BDR57752.1 hypothetical protein XA3_01930 [Xylocopilactobacillus apicola]